MSTKPFECEAAAARTWWKSLQPREEKGQMIPGDRAAVARLKRCDTALAAAAEPAVARLLAKLFPDAPRGKRIDMLPRVAALAAVLAHVKENGGTGFAQALGKPRDGEGSTPVLSPVRFKRFQTTRGADETLMSFRRAVLLLNRTADIRDLARVLLAWDDDDVGDRTRTIFAFDYHGAGIAAPEADPSADPAPTSDKDE
ncbi:MAG TPA: type I-E CRISPR-associated protein Cse2/CasB [Hyphomicrobium sp.]|nr:type I-E CRISPR-associated protein Cse2/CasB [Hyphomicrobium sp.]